MITIQLLTRRYAFEEASSLDQQAATELKRGGTIEQASVEKIEFVAGSLLARRNGRLDNLSANYEKITGESSLSATVGKLRSPIFNNLKK